MVKIILISYFLLTFSTGALADPCGYRVRTGLKNGFTDKEIAHARTDLKPGGRGFTFLPTRDFFSKASLERLYKKIKAEWPGQNAVGSNNGDFDFNSLDISEYFGKRFMKYIEAAEDGMNQSLPAREKVEAYYLVFFVDGTTNGTWHSDAAVHTVLLTHFFGPKPRVVDVRKRGLGARLDPEGANLRIFKPRRGDSIAMSSEIRAETVRGVSASWHSGPKIYDKYYYPDRPSKKRFAVLVGFRRKKSAKD